ncbi:MAG TPA: peptidoglycan-binding domain-containing protein [Solirubrobacteraceae bacterium]|nr:peptidoglycan-binding domain-containing protein [Solirubrobacteraceae bacterium]
MLCPLAGLTDATGASAAGAGGTASPAGAAPPVASAPAKRAPAKPPAASRTTSKSKGSSGLHVTSVRITSVRCLPEAKCSGNPHQVSVHGTLLLTGKGLASGSTIAFPRTPGARIGGNSPTSRLRKTVVGLVLTVPASAHSGHIMVLLGGARHSSSYGPIYVYRHALHPPPKPKPVVQPAPAAVGAVGPSPFEGQGMWIWYVAQSNHGSVASIVAQAHAAAVSTVFVKSADGSSNYWGQFSSQLVAELHANGLKVCAWQYVYGTNPAGEANLGAEAVANGADCLVIDAEAEYEGHYAAAQTYIDDLRAKIGPAYPLGLASFPYVSYHGSFPYSVFLGPNGAQYNAPQMYWKDIGVSVDTVYANTYIANRIYGRPIFPLGQTYGGVSASDLLRFREEAVDYGATGVSFWDWQETPASGWSTLAAPLAPLGSVVPNAEYPELRSGAKGDQVLWLQEHLASAIAAQEVTGSFGSQTTANLKSFQTAHALAPTGVAEPPTWAALLALPPVAVNWTGGGPEG